MNRLGRNLAAQAALLALASESAAPPQEIEGEQVVTFELESMNLGGSGPWRKGPTPNKYEPLKCEGTRQQQRYAKQQAKIAARKAQTKGPDQ